MNENEKQLEIINNHVNSIPAIMQEIEDEKKHDREVAFEAAFPALFLGIVIGLIMADLLLR